MTKHYSLLHFETGLTFSLCPCFAQTEQVAPHADLCPAADSSGSSTPAPSVARTTLPPISTSTLIPTVAPIAAEIPSSTLIPSSFAPVDGSGSPIPETLNPSTVPVAIPSETQPVSSDSPFTPAPVVSRTLAPTGTTTTLAPTQVAQTNRPTTTTRAPLSTVAPVKESTPTPGEQKKKKTVCSHIKKNDKKDSDKASKSKNSSSKGGKGSVASKNGKGSANSKGGKGSASSKGGKGSATSKSSESVESETSIETNEDGKGSKSGKKAKKKRNKRRKKKKKNQPGNIWSRTNGNRRILTETEKRNAYFRVREDVFQKRVADVSTNTTISGAAVDEAVYVAIYKEVFKDAECYEIDVDEPSELAPAFSPPTSAEEPTFLNSSNSPVSISPLISPSPSILITPPSAAPSVGLSSSISPTNATNSSISTPFDNLVLDRANMTLDDRSSSVNGTSKTQESVAAAPAINHAALINAFLASFSAGTLLISSVLLIRWYGPRKPMWHIVIPSSKRSSGASEDDDEADDDDEGSVESRLTDDKRMGV